MHRLVWMLLLIPAGLAAGPPGALAIRGARVVTVSGAAVEPGTVVIRDGLIEAVGANPTIPPDAWTIEGKGLTVYPGLIDALSTIGLPESAVAEEPSARPQRVPRPAPETPPARGPEDRPSNTSWLRAADLFNASDKKIESARNLGFTTAVVFPTRGIFAGQGAVVNLAGEAAGKMIVSTPAGLYLSFATRGFAEYPGSLMGVLAYIRQVSLDAGHSGLENAHYARRTAGTKRPAYDRAVEGWLEAPRVLLPASRAVEIDRMLRFANGLRATPVLYGGQEAHRSAARLKSAGVPVLISLKWPERAKDADPEDVESLRVLEYRDRAPSSPAALAKAGARFAFYTEGLKASELAKAVKRALDAGLAPADLVRAFTLSPAEIFGVADRLGSIEPGKIANLVVTEGELFGEKTKVKYIVVDGVKYQPAPESEEKEAAK
jgi:hypothetical protein